MARTTQDILSDALGLSGVLEIGESPVADYTKIALDRFNEMVVGWQNEHEISWLEVDIQVPMTGNTSYKLGPNGVEVEGVQIEKTVTTLAPIGQTFLILDSTSELNEEDPYTVGANTGTIVQVYDETRIIIQALTEEVLADATALFGSKLVPRPIAVKFPRYDNTFNEISIEMVGRAEYLAQPYKESTGTPNQVFYEKRLTDGVVNVWPVIDAGTLNIVVSLPFEEIELDDITEPLPFPSLWNRAIVFNLAVAISGWFGTQLRQDVALQAIGSLETAMGDDSYRSDVIFQYGWE
jgi:hypothetical protein